MLEPQHRLRSDSYFSPNDIWRFTSLICDVLIGDVANMTSHSSNIVVTLVILPIWHHDIVSRRASVITLSPPSRSKLHSRNPHLAATAFHHWQQQKTSTGSTRLHALLLADAAGSLSMINLRDKQPQLWPQQASPSPQQRRDRALLDRRFVLLVCPQWRWPEGWTGAHPSWRGATSRKTGQQTSATEWARAGATRLGRQRMSSAPLPAVGAAAAPLQAPGADRDGDCLSPRPCPCLHRGHHWQERQWQGLLSSLPSLSVGESKPIIISLNFLVLVLP
jgi:hypothetical protein